MDKVRIPVALQIVTDDVGWFYGKHELAESGPARTAIYRDHVAEDYLVLNEIGKGIDMKITCGFTIGEWDKDNVLRGMKHATREEENWDRKSTIDMELARRFFKIIEESDYIDIAFHGLMHGYWIDGENYGNPREFYTYDLPDGATERRLDYPCVPVCADYVDSHLEAWFKIYNSWGFTKKVKTFISPAGLHRDRQKAIEYAEKIEKYGIRFWKNGWQDFKGLTDVFGNIIFLNCSNELLPFDAIDVDPDTLPDLRFKKNADGNTPALAVFGSHWPNFLRSDPEKNFEYVDRWERYFKHQSEVFGIMLSKDIAFAASQAQYHTHAKADLSDNTLTIDISQVDKQGAAELSNDFYISIKNGLSPKSCDGAAIELYETHDAFTTYKLTRTEKEIIKIQLFPCLDPGFVPV